MKITTKEEVLCNLGECVQYKTLWNKATLLQEKIRNAKGYNSDWIVTTEKDIMRLRSFSTPENLVSLAIEFTVDEKFYDEVFSFDRVLRT